MALLLVVTLVASWFSLSPTAQAGPSPSGATIASDLADYNPGGTVTLTGTGWASAESVHIVVSDLSSTPGTPVVVRDVTVVAQTDGTLTDVFTLPTYFVADYGVVATGPISGTATTSFTDANPSANLDQCANDQAPSPASDGCDTNANQWVNGNLGSSKAVYYEGDSVPYRLTMDNLTLNSHTVTIEWDTTKGGTHALDYLTSFNRTVTTANPCLGVTGCNAGSFTTFAIPADPQVTGAGVTPVPGNFTMYGGTITGVSAYSYPNGTGFTGDKSARISITFTASVVNPVLAWGGHISSRANWGLNGSAVAISGSPYHTRLIDLDGAGGNQDRSLSADAVVFPGSITIIKDATPNGSTSFGFTASPAPLSDFSLVDDGTTANTKVFSNITNFQTYTVAETLPTAWTLTSISCSVTTPNGGSYDVTLPSVDIALNEGENWTCTFSNTQQPAYLTVTKVVTNDDGGTAAPDDFNLTIDGTPTTSGTTVQVAPGTYTVGETQLAGYSFSGFSGDCDTNGSVTIAAGESKSCTLTNDDQQAYITVNKVVVNDSGGSALPDDFDLTLEGNAVTSGVAVPVDPGTYTAGETLLDGYTFTGFSGDCDANGDVTVALGESKTCTLTNDDQQAYITVNKVVVNDNGGSAAPDDFALTLEGTATTSGTAVPVNPGTYTAGETLLDGYSFTGFSGDCDSNGDVTVALGESKTCTLTNDDEQAYVIVEKTVINDNGGTAAADDFALTLEGSPTTSGTAVPVNPGTYTAGETQLPGYTFTGFSGDCDSNGDVTVALGETKTCTLTNDDQQAYITVVKLVDNSNGGTAAPDDFALTLGGDSVTSGVAVPVAPGTYTAGETLLDGYTFTGFSGDCDSNGSVTVALGESKTCTLSNDDQQAYVIVEKTVINDNGGSAQPDDFSLTLDGNATTSGTKIAVNPGTYTASETQLPGYTFTGFSGDCDSNGDVTVALGETKTCTLTNDDEQAYVIVEKTVVNDDGGSAQPDDFSLTLDGSATTSGTAVPVNPGTHTAGETQLPGYTFTGFSGDCDSNGDTTVALGETKTCTLTNDDQQAYVIVEKVVVNDNGGSAQPDDFSLTLDGTATTSGTAVPVDPGTHTASETQLDGYTFTGFSNDCDSNGDVTVALGETKTCTLTNDDQQAYVIVEKVVVNDNGGSAQPDDFSLTLDGTATTSGTAVPVNPGTYTAGETQLDGYTFTGFSNDCDSNGDVTVALGETKTCTLTNDDEQAYITVNKVVVNDNGGGAAPDDFALTLEGNATTSGTQVAVDPGTYTAGETLLDGYTFTGFTGDCDANGDVTVALGESKSCTLTNDDIAPILHLRKVVVNDNGGTKTEADFTLRANGTGTNDLSGTSPVDSGTGLQADTWALSETSVYGYTASAWECVGGTQDGSNITVGIGGEATCTITNDDQPGTIVVIKNAKPAQGSFAFTTTGTGYDGFTLTGATTNDGNVNSQDLDAGSYTVKETTQLGWVLTGIGGSIDPSTPYDCTVTGSGGSTGVGDLNTQTASISLKNGDTVTCVFENTGQGVTRTQGFWATHPQLAEIAWFGGTAFGHTFPGVAATSGIGDTTICGRSIDTLGKLMGGFWSDIPKTSTGAKRSSIDQARMQLLQQLLAAELNASAFGSVPSSGSFTAWESALCGTNQNAIKTAQQQAASFNTAGDSGKFTPGTSADSKYARLIADRPFWNIIKP